LTLRERGLGVRRDGNDGKHGGMTMKIDVKRVCLITLLLGIMVMLMAAAGCSSDSATTDTTPGGSITSVSSGGSTTSSAESTETTSEATEVTETLRIGLVVYKGWAVGLDLANTADIMTAVINDAGGLEVGGKKYQIELVVYDSDNTQDGAVTAMNRLVFEDKVKYVLNDSTGVEALIPIAENNGVVLLAMGVAPALFSLDNHYTFPADGSYAGSPAILGWLKDNFPEKKTVALAFTDDQMGHANAEVQTQSWTTAGFEVVATEFFPSGQTDLSAVATKVMSANPDIVWPNGSGPTLSEGIVKAVYERGYKGLFAMGNATLATTLLEMVPEAALTNYVNYGYDVEFDPALTTIAESFREAWIKKNGEWTGPEVSGASFCSCLASAAQKAGSIEPDAIAAAISSGLEWDSPAGALRMVSLEENGSYTNIGLLAYNVKKIVDSEPVFQGTISLDRMEELFYQLVAPSLAQ
jgi:branched-chain amino acid transport system substrate-binding protein